ncbi:exonuclease SbcCD subunit D [Parahaliea aestuarii]|uniref:Nuclease SbcCD subunit D n=1 Tax=Parahaliea aestuarii TaxID=1852021 RepID=A0A5C8ZRM4_9GAMM|nr:exonuclease SbcCD subunit D [Parahaliea aestuarii]TXS91163.1 exonuclease SbcCD subunit D [Parahaliea aestuarii]
MRILHTSDWHLGRQLHGRSLLADQAHVLEQVLDIAERDEVDVVLIAGDVYDRAVPPAEAVSLLGNTLRRLCVELGKQVILIAGNHDSAERLGFAAELLGHAGLHIVGPLTAEPRPLTLVAAERGGHTVSAIAVDFFGLPYAGPAQVRQTLGVEVSSHDEAMGALLERVESARDHSRPCVVMAHCFVAGGEASDSERPLSLGGADQVAGDRFAPYTYAALGHLHGPQHRGAQHIRYSGSILKYSFSEARQRKSVTLVDIDGAGGVTIAQRDLKPLRDVRIIEGSLDALLATGHTDPAADDFICARLTGSGAVLDVMGKLRAVYPNALQAVRLTRDSGGARFGAGRDVLKQSQYELFREFYCHVQGEGMSDAQQRYLQSLLQALQQEGSL